MLWQGIIALLITALFSNFLQKDRLRKKIKNQEELEKAEETFVQNI
jgi:hypothetical protein